MQCKKCLIYNSLLVFFWLNGNPPLGVCQRFSNQIGKSTAKCRDWRDYARMIDVEKLAGWAVLYQPIGDIQQVWIDVLPSTHNL